MYSKPKIHMPTVGMRILKSSIAVLLCYIVYMLRGESGVLFYSQLAALWCIQPYLDSTLKNALQRTVGTFIGAAFGLLIIVLLYNVFPVQNLILEAILTSLTIIPVIYMSVCLHKKDAAFFSCVVFLSIVVLHIEDANPVFFVWERFSDTMLGILIGIAVNSFHLPHKRRYDLLFVSGLDETLLTRKERLSDYSIVELNQMLKKGLRFTISTRRTPASFIDTVQQIHLNLPIIAMDGAVLYDLNSKKYLQVNVISYAKTMELVKQICTAGFQCFINAVIDDTLIIYHQELHNPAEKDIYKKMYSSPYRNYLQMELPENTLCVYLMFIDETEKIDAFYRQLQTKGFTSSLKILRYTSNDYPGFSYIKIYNKTAKRENMVQVLMKELGCSQTLTFGSIAGKYDYAVSIDQPDRVVHLIKKRFEPLGLPWNSVKAKKSEVMRNPSVDQGNPF